MNAIQARKLSRYDSVQALLQEPRILRAHPKLPAKLNALNAKLDELHALFLTQMRPTYGQTRKRNQCYAAMIEATLEVSGLLQIYAAEQSRADLAYAARVLPSEFARARVRERVVIAQRIHDVAAPLVEDNVDCGVDAERLADLQAKIDAAGSAQVQTRMVIVYRKAATECIAKAIAKIDTFLAREIDPLAFLLRRTHTEFYLKYFAERAPRGRQPFGIDGPERNLAANSTSPAGVTLALLPPLENENAPIESARVETPSVPQTNSVA